MNHIYDLLFAYLSIFFSNSHYNYVLKSEQRNFFYNIIMIFFSLRYSYKPILILYIDVLKYNRADIDTYYNTIYYNMDNITSIFTVHLSLKYEK